MCERRPVGSRRDDSYICQTGSESAAGKSQTGVCLAVCMCVCVRKQGSRVWNLGWREDFIHPVFPSLHSAWMKTKCCSSCFSPLTVPSPPLLSGNAFIHQSGRRRIRFCFVYSESGGCAELGLLRKQFVTLCVCVVALLEYVREVWVSCEFVCSLFLTLAGPMCVAHASTRTAARAGKLCQEGTSVLFVSYWLIPSLLVGLGEIKIQMN